MNVLTSILGILSLFNYVIGCSRIAPLTHVVMAMRGFTCRHVVLSACLSGLYFNGLFVVGGVSKFVVVVGEFLELYGVWWGMT